MFLLLLALFGLCRASPLDPNMSMDRVLRIVSEIASKSHAMPDYTWTGFYGLARLTLKDVSFWDAATPMRLGKVVVTTENNLTRIEAALSLSTMELNYEHYELVLPFYSSSGRASFKIGVNSFGVTAYYGKDCETTKAYVWTPRGNPSVEVSDPSFVSEWAVYLFNYLSSGIIQNIVDNAVMWDALVAATTDPLAKAIGTVFCESK